MLFEYKINDGPLANKTLFGLEKIKDSFSIKGSFATLIHMSNVKNEPRLLTRLGFNDYYEFKNMISDKMNPRKYNSMNIDEIWLLLV